jgi:Ca2+-binding RTX toxin-like protein
MVKLSNALWHDENSLGFKTKAVNAAADYQDLGVYTVSAVSLEPLASASTFNTGFHWESTSGLPSIVSDFVGTDLRGNPVLAHGPNEPGTVRWQLDAGVSITPTKGVITFAFLDSSHATGIYNNPNQGFTEQFGYSPFSAAQRVAGRTAIANWDELIAPTFKEVNGSGGADIVMANTTTGPAQAWAYYPYNYGESNLNHLMSDAWIASPSVNGSNNQLLPGQYGLQTLNHELGHTLGLSHPGAYNFGDDLDGDGQPDPITYDGDAFYFQDSNQYSIMSYFDSYETGAQNIDWNLMRFIYPSTPMVDDVRVIQQKYGADMTTRTGNTVYGFNSTADVTNEAMKFHTGEMATIFTIWDAGGNDTLDLSGYQTDSVIDLRPGAYSSAGGYGAYNATLIGNDPTLAQINLNNTAAGMGPRSAALFDIYFKGVDGINEGISWKDITGTGDKLLMEQNIGIAYGAIIENAIGGGGNDRINGNSANNVFTGGAGDDTFIFARYGVGDASIDTISDFQTGHDKIDLTEFAGVNASRVQFDAGTDTLRVDINLDGFGANDLTIVVHGNDVAAGDYIFG